MALSGAERQKRYIDKLKRQAAAAAGLARRVAELEAAQAPMLEVAVAAGPDNTTGISRSPPLPAERCVNRASSRDVGQFHHGDQRLALGRVHARTARRRLDR